MYIDLRNYKDLSSDAKMIQAALDEATTCGKAVLIPKCNPRTGEDIYHIDETMYLYDDTVLILQNCHLRLTDGSICNMFSNKNARTNLGKQHNIHIMGVGKPVLDGGVHNKLYEYNGIARKVMKPTTHHVTENCMLFFQNVERLIIDNISIKDQRYWAICCISVSHSRISNIHFSSAGNVPNQDGIDILKGCHDVIVENITGCVGDDLVALTATDSDLYCDAAKTKGAGDIHNVTVRNIMGYGVGGCAMIRILNHDGNRIYNVKIDNVIECSPWADTDAPLAQNPDLIIKTDDEGNLLPVRTIIPGEDGYRMEACIRIGEPYWYAHTQAQHGDTFGISISNVMTHARFALCLNNTVKDATFDNIRVFGNGHMLAYMGKGQYENLRFSNINYDSDAKPHTGDQKVYVEWNEIKTEGFHSVYFNNAQLKNCRFQNLCVPAGIMDSVFGGQATGDATASQIISNGTPVSSVQGICLD